MINKYLTKDEKKFGCYVYMFSARWNLKYKSVHRYYTGLTSDIQRRWREHLIGIKSGWKGKMNWWYHKKPSSMSLDFIGIVPKGISFRIAEEYIQNLPKKKKVAINKFRI